MRVEDTIISVHNLSKSFPGVQALSNITIAFKKGEVHALVGENGAGKSTLINILSGHYQPDSGSILSNNRELNFQNPRDAWEFGISTIYQELNLIQKLTVFENIYLGRQPKTFGFVNTKEMQLKTQKICDEYKIELDIKKCVKELSLAKKQMVEIVKALSFDAKIVIMDEPTSSLSIHETNILLEIIRNLKETGITVIFITHRLDEIFCIADQLSILRDGKLIDTKDIKSTSKKEVISLMVGRDLKQQYPERVGVIGEVVLKAEHFSDDEKVKDVSFELFKGEVLGFSGLVGAGRTEVMKLLFGFNKKASGQLLIHGKLAHIKSPKDSIKHGLGFLTEDRKSEGLLLRFPVKFNIVMVALHKIKKYGILNLNLEKKFSRNLIDAFRIKTPSENQAVINLSGGNQQKVVLSKWIFSDSEIVIMDEPTRGIDVGSKREIYELINKLVTKEGKSVIIVSSEIEELLGICDRIIVMYEGEITGTVNKNEFSQPLIMKYSVGEVS